MPMLHHPLLTIALVTLVVAQCSATRPSEAIAEDRDVESQPHMIPAS
jgi:hypothetical protein